MNKKLILIILLFLNSAFSQIIVPDTSKMSNIEKMLWYENEKKSPGLGVLFSFLLPTAGHVYAGDWKRGLLFKGTQIGNIFLTIYLNNKAWGEYDRTYIGPGYGAETKYPDYDARLERQSFYPLWTNIFILFPWEIYDLTKTVKKYNQQLYEKLFGKLP